MGRLLLAAALSLCAVRVSRAVLADFDVFVCGLNSLALAAPGADLREGLFLCRDKDRTVVKGSYAGSSGAAYFEGIYDSSTDTAFLAIRAVVLNGSPIAGSAVSGNPDKLQLQTAHAWANFSNADSHDFDFNFEQKLWSGGPASPGDDPLDLAGQIQVQGTQKCKKIDMSSEPDPELLYNRACLSMGGLGAAGAMGSVVGLPEGFDGTLWTGTGTASAMASEQVAICYMGASTVMYHTDSADQSAGYMQPSHTLRFEGRGALGIAFVAGFTEGPNKGYQRFGVGIASQHASSNTHPAILNALSCLLDPVHGGVLNGSCVHLQYQLVAGTGPHVCDAARVVGFEPVARQCEPDDVAGYVSPWAPAAYAMESVAGAAIDSIDSQTTMILECRRSLPLLGDESQTGAGSMRLEYHCLQSSSGAYDDYDYVSGSFGFHGFFEGPLVPLGQREATGYINYFQMTPTGPQSGAAVLTYDMNTGNGTSVGGRTSVGGDWNPLSCVQLTDVDLKQQVLADFCLVPTSDAPAAAWAGVCRNAPGFLDSRGRGCDEYESNPAWCEGSRGDGVYDPPSVYANTAGQDASQACCVCKQTSLPLSGSQWLRQPKPSEPASHDMGEVTFCNQGRNPVLKHSWRQLDPACTMRQIREKTCELTPWENRTTDSDSLVFAGSSSRVLGFVGGYTEAGGSSGHMLLTLTGPKTLKGFVCVHGYTASFSQLRMTQCTTVTYELAGQDLACESVVKTSCRLRRSDGSDMQFVDLRPMRSTQSFFTGGLGEVARKSSAAAKQYGVWACVKDWNSTQQLFCGTGPGRLACFKYEEVSGKFEFWGLNADLRLIFKSDSERSTFV